MIIFGKEYILDRQGEELYLERWQILKSKVTSWYLHKFHQGDDPVFHDHPCAIITFPLWKGYLEHRLDPYTGKKTTVRRYPFVPAYRSGTDLHWVELLPGSKPWSLCIFFPRYKPWGFVETWHNEFKWTQHQKYLNARRAKKEKKSS